MADDVPEKTAVVFVTREEARAWRRAREYGELRAGYLGDWFTNMFGKEAWLVARAGGALIERPDAGKIPGILVPERVAYLTEAQIEEVLDAKA
jgi:hypothetical protein